MVGLQAYAYDVNDEGADAVVRAAELTAANVVYLAVSYNDAITTRDPARAPRLLHNPVRTRHADQAFITPDSSRYPSGLIPPVSPEADLDGDRAYAALRSAADRHRLAVVPWFLLLSQRVAMESQACSVVNPRGDAVAGWLCPSQTAVRAFARALATDIVERYQPPAIFLDGARFPEPRPGRIVDGLGCFCDACLRQGKERGIDMEAVRARLLDLVALVEQRPDEFASATRELFSSGFRTIRALAMRHELLGWLRMRQAAVETIVTDVREAVAGRAELWLDVWPPSYGWLLGQDLAALAASAVWTRPFTYHRWGGGADIPGLIGSVSNDPAVQEQLYDAFRHFFRFPGPAGYGEFLDRGLDPAFITEETAFTAALLAGRSRPVAGLQLWQMGPEGVRTALENAVAADPAGVILHCYGWSSEAEMRAAGDWLRDRADLRAGHTDSSAVRAPAART